MPKQKTHRGLAKRVKRTGKGGLKRFRAFTSHRFHGKTKKQRRQLRKSVYGFKRRLQTYPPTIGTHEIIAQPALQLKKIQ